MPEYIITLNVGFGDEHEKIEADNKEAADNEAYQRFKEECENSHEYYTREFTEELAKELEIE